MSDEKIPGGSFSHIQGAFLFCMSNCPLINPEIKTGKKWHYWDTKIPGTAGQSRKSFFNIRGVGFHKAIYDLLFNLPFARKNSLLMYFLVMKVYIGNSLCIGTEACWHIQFPLQQVLRLPLSTGSTCWIWLDWILIAMTLEWIFCAVCLFTGFHHHHGEVDHSFSSMCCLRLEWCNRWDTLQTHVHTSKHILNMHRSNNPSLNLMSLLMTHLSPQQSPPWSLLKCSSRTFLWVRWWTWDVSFMGVTARLQFRPHEMCGCPCAALNLLVRINFHE